MPANLDQLVSDVIDLTGADKPSLYDDDAPVLADEVLDATDGEGFYLVGLIGGKEVGKSALVNALVGREITQSTSFGEGTQIVTAYTHTSQVPALRELLDRQVPGRYQVVTHDNPRLARQVLLDLPDIDSHWAEHVEITRRMLRQMLFPIWMQSVEKYADLQPQQMLAKVAAGNAADNFVFALNKADQLIKQEGQAAADELREDYARRLQRVLSLPEPPRVFMISAIHPTDYDLPQLRTKLGEQKTAREVDTGKRAAAKQQGSSVLGWIRRQNLPEHARRLAAVQENAEEVINDRLGSPLLERCIPAILDDPAHRLTTLDDCLKSRAARWPFVNIVQGLAAPVAAMFRRRLSLDQQRNLEGPESLVDSYLRPGGRDLSSAIQTTFAHLQQSQPMISSLYRNRKFWEARQADIAAGELHRSLSDTVSRQRAVISRRVCGRSGPVGHLVRGILTIGALIWFPIVQPILQAALEDTLGHSFRTIALAVVRALSVTALLQTLAFLALYYFLIWVIVRWDTSRRVDRQLQRWKTADSLDPTLSLPGQALEWLQGLQDPVREARERVEGLVKRAEELEGELESRAA
ncbi:MAG TPA: GTPase domain-containing protein [Tepidisphaeraceae bacterium]